MSRHSIAGGCPEEYISLFESPVTMTGGPLVSASIGIVSVGDKNIEVSRCASTMLACDDSPPWVCRVCKRRYALPPQLVVGDHLSLPECLFCGLHLATAAPRQFLVAPGCIGVDKD